MKRANTTTGSRWPRLAVQLCVAAVLVTLTWQASAPAANGQMRRWSQPARLSSSFGWFPDIIADLKGKVHVVWSAGDSTYDTVLYTSTQDGKEWSSEIDVAAMLSGGEVTRPALLVDQLGQIHMSFRERTVYYTWAPAASAGLAAAWLEPKALSGSQIAYFSRLAMDGQNRLHLVYTENVITPECPLCYHVFHRRSSDNGLNWTPSVDIASLPTGAAKPQILIDKQDNVHVVWEAGEGGSYGQLVEPTKVMYAASYDGGNTWTRPFDMGATSERAKNITIGLDGDNQLVIVWLGMPEDQVYYQVSRNQGREWTAPRPIQQVWGAYSVYQGRTDDYAMATDGAGDIHLALVGRTDRDQKSLSVLHLTWHSSVWTELEVITTLTDDVPEWPRIAISLGNQLYAVWFVRDEAHVFDTDRGEYAIWTSHGMSQAPAATPLPAWPTQAPRATPRAAQAPTAAPTRIPVVATGLPQTTVNSLYNEFDSMVLLAKVGLLVVALILVVLAVVNIRRRQQR